MVREMGPGRTLDGRYRIRNRVGSGGLGSVWTAYDEALRVEATVEAVGAAGSERMARVARTLRAAALLRDHPNVIPVYDIVETDGVLWTVMPLVSGPSLADHLAEQGRMSGERNLLSDRSADRHEQSSTGRAGDGRDRGDRGPGEPARLRRPPSLHRE